MLFFPEAFHFDGFRRGLMTSMNPFLDYSSMFQPTQYINALRWCHTPNTLIEIDDGNAVSIKDLRVGDVVRTHTGELKKVTNIICHEYDGDILIVHSVGSYPLEVTSDHEVFVLTSSGEIVRKRADRINPGEALISIPIISGVDFPSLIRELQSLSSRVSSSEIVIYADEMALSDVKSLVLKLYRYHRLCESIKVRSYYKLYQLRVVYADYENPTINKGLDIQFTDEYIARQITLVERKKYKGLVYSITVEDDHSYLANGSLCGNCEYIVASNGVLRAAMDRIVSFFVTDVEVTGGDLNHRKRAEEYLREHLSIISTLRYISLDYLTYGNFFVSLRTPFVRRLCCQTCNNYLSINALCDQDQDVIPEKVAGGYIYVTGFCPLCKNNASFRVEKDRKDKDETKYRLKRWNVYEIRLSEFDVFSDEVDIIWDVPDEYRTDVLRGNKNALKNLNYELLEAIINGNDIKFNKDSIYHGKEDTLCGIRMKGWGLPRIFASLRHAWLVQVLHRVNEAVGMDYVIPLRILTPVPRGGGEVGDIMGVANFGDFSSAISSILERRRRDPLMWHVSPWPIDYKSLGGDGRAFTPHEIYQQSIDILLNSMNIPIEFYKGSLQVQAAPMTLRLMETSWSHIISVINKFLAWLKNRLVAGLDWDPSIAIRLARPTHIDDAQRQMMKLQLMTSGQLSRELGLQSLGIDLRENIRRQMEEEVYIAQQSAEAQKKMQNIGLGDQLASPPQDMSMAVDGAAGGGIQVVGGTDGSAPQAQSAPVSAGDPVAQIMANLPASGLQNMNPQEMDQLAAQVANAIYGLPETHKDSALRQLKIRNEMLWMVVKEKLNDIQAAARRQGLSQVKQQAAQSAAMTVNPPM